MLLEAGSSKCLRTSEIECVQMGRGAVRASGRRTAGQQGTHQGPREAYLDMQRTVDAQVKSLAFSQEVTGAAEGTELL